MKKVFFRSLGEVDKFTYPEMETILNDLHNISKTIETLETSKRYLSDQLAIRK
jgi:hypothetical protein